MAKSGPSRSLLRQQLSDKSLRGLGYWPETAIADLIDNSIAARAATVELALHWNEGRPEAALLDDGNGMDRATLAEALRLGGIGPSSARMAAISAGSVWV